MSHNRGSIQVIILAVGLAISLSACARLGAQSRVDPATIAVYPDSEKRPGRSATDTRRCPLQRSQHDFERGAIDLDCFMFPEDLRPPTGVTEGQLAYARAVESKRERNRLSALLLKHSDDLCTVELGRLNSNEATVNTSLSVLTTTLTTVANIVTGERASEILTGAATVASGSRDHINVHVYRNQVAYAVSRAIALERQTRREAIESRYIDAPDLWTVDDAIRAVNAYHQQCSFYKGLELLLASVESKANADRYMDKREKQNEVDDLVREIAAEEAALDDAQVSEREPILTRINALKKRKQELQFGASVASQPVATDAPGDKPANPQN